MEHLSCTKIYAKYFGKDSEILEETPEVYRDTQWINIKDLDLSYVKSTKPIQVYHKEST